MPKVMVNDLRSQEVIVDFNNGKAVRYPSFWLRDYCQCAKCTHPQTRQRQVDTFELDPETKATHAEAVAEGLKIVWSDSRHESLYPWTWLQNHVPFGPNTTIDANPRGGAQFVSASGPFPNVDYHQAMTTDEGLNTLLSQIRQHGFTFIDSTPATTEATEALANRIAFIRQTHYGGFWEVVSEANPIDTAYTNLFLPNHTDNTYFTDPCGLQMFHCLSHTSASTSGSSASPISPKEDNTVESGLGGESTFVDGFAAATRLHKLNPEYYNILSNTRIISHASGDEKAGSILNNAVHSTGFPVFTHHTTNAKSNPKDLSIIRWNNSDRHSSTPFPSHQAMQTWYSAARLWNQIIHDPEFEIVIKLTPGSVVVFDNWRVLHGRKAFQGTRRLCGAYIGMDDFLGRGRAVMERLNGQSKRGEN